jgi:hypothetical protein
MFKASPAGGLTAAALIGMLAGLPLAAAAQVYKCPQAGGSFSYQGTPCPASGKAPARPTAAELNAQKPPAEDKPFYDPYASNPSTRPHPVAPVMQVPQAQRTPVDNAPAARPTLAQQQARYDRERVQDENERIRKENARTEANNQSIRCNSARQTLGVLSEQVPVYRRDNAGNRVYVSDASRAGEIAAAQQRVSAECH